ncbi:MAG: hypothetical protein M1531_04065, partial [Chloroflexi bacterium]|nr:hypothetical protein [Chloroflexota bacterium]
RGARSTQSRIRKQLDAVDGVITPSWATRLLTSSGARQAILRGDALFVLDTTAGTLARYRLSGNALAPTGGDPVLLRRGDRAGYITAGDLLGMVWMPAGGARDAPALLVLDRNGLLFEYDEGRELSALLLRGGPTWNKVHALAGYAGMLYLLDTQSREVLWYPATADGYNGPIYRYLDPMVSLDVSTAQDMKVDEDLFLLMGNGQVTKLRLGKPLPFELRPPDGPLQEPRRLFLGKDSLFVADVARYRIVEFDRDGNYVQQMRYESNENVFADLRDFVVDKANHRLIIVNGKGVYLLEWPAGNQ